MTPPPGAAGDTPRDGRPDVPPSRPASPPGPGNPASPAAAPSSPAGGAAAPRRRVWLIGAAGGLAAAAGIGGALWHERRRPPDPAVWARRFATPAGGELALADFLGRPLLLNFWATWCPPCVREMPLLDRFHRTQQPRGAQVLGLAIDSREPVRQFLQRSPVSYPVALGGLDGVQLVRTLGNPGGGLPFSVLFDADGRSLRQHLGELTPEMLQQWGA